MTPISKKSTASEQLLLLKLPNGQAEHEVREQVEEALKEENISIVESKIPDLPLTVTAKVLKAITAALNLMLWLPMKAVDAIQFALAPADPVTFNTRKLRRKRKLCFVRLELPSGK